MANALSDSDTEENVLDYDRNAIVEPYRFEPKRRRIVQDTSSDETDTDPLTECETGPEEMATEPLDVW